MNLSVLKNSFAVSKLDSNAPIPSWATQGSIFSINKNEDELSIVCEQENVPEGVKAEKDWRIFKVQGPLDFGLTGILASISTPLAESKISIFAISTFDTDYVMVRAKDLENARLALSRAGFTII